MFSIAELLLLSASNLQVDLAVHTRYTVGPVIVQFAFTMDVHPATYFDTPYFLRLS